jgi:hypothetical protein
VANEKRAVSVADRYNEGKALDAVLRFIEARDGALRQSDGRSPEDPKDLPSWPAMVDREPMPYSEFDPNELTKLTSR